MKTAEQSRDRHIPIQQATGHAGSRSGNCHCSKPPRVLRYTAENLLANRLELQRLLGNDGVSAAAVDDAIAANSSILYSKPATVLVKIRKASVKGRSGKQVMKDKCLMSRLLRVRVQTNYGRIDHLVNLLGCPTERAEQIVKQFPDLSDLTEGQLRERFDNAMAVFRCDAHGTARLLVSEAKLLTYTPDGVASRLSFVMESFTAAVNDIGVQKWRDQLSNLSARDKLRLLRGSIAAFDRLRLAPTISPRLCAHSFTSIISMSNSRWTALQVRHQQVTKAVTSQQAV